MLICSIFLLFYLEIKTESVPATTVKYVKSTICAFHSSESPTFSPHSIEINDSKQTLNLKRFETVYCPDNIKKFSHFLNETVDER